jgi:hypothetical protein
MRAEAGWGAGEGEVQARAFLDEATAEGVVVDP